MNIFDSAIHHLWFKVSIILLVTAGLGFFLRRALLRLERYSSTPDWLISLCETSYTPIAWLIWGYGILLSIKIGGNHTELNVPTDIVMSIGSIFFVLTITWILLKWKGKYEKCLKKRLLIKDSNSDNDALILAVGKVFTVVLLVISTMIVLEIIGIPLTALLTFGGLGGIAIGLAGKDVFVNLFGGLMIHINRPFVVGDTISSSNKNFEGTVEQIGWYNTQIRTFERRPLYIPNSIISEAIIENTGRMYNRRIKEIINIRFEDVDKVDQIVDQIETMLNNHKDIDQEQSIMVDLVALGEFSLNIEVCCFTKSIILKEWRRIRQNIFLKIIRILDENKAQMPYPIASVNLHAPLQYNLKKYYNKLHVNQKLII